jgi:hypothetical protein
MSRSIYFAFIAAFLFSRTCFADDAISLNCDSDKPKAEQSAIQAAGSGVKRTGKHELVVAAGGKTLHFRDKKPYDNPTEGGETYRFCGYKSGYFLLAKQDSSASTGVLINEKTGVVTPAGNRVSFAPDHRAYVAIEDPNCADGEFWKVYAINGRMSWSGDNYISRTKQDSFFTIDEPVWTESGELTATASCSGVPNENSWKVTLKNIDGQWNWQPYRECKP